MFSVIQDMQTARRAQCKDTEKENFQNYLENGMNDVCIRRGFFEDII